jgi:hypothetical protein
MPRGLVAWLPRVARCYRHPRALPAPCAGVAVSAGGRLFSLPSRWDGRCPPMNVPSYLASAIGAQTSQGRSLVTLATNRYCEQIPVEIQCF